MTDRELLERAALAYWGDEIDDVCSIRWLETDQAIGYTHGDNQDHNGIDLELVWNPLDHDGDAFRLAVKLRLTINPYQQGVFVSRYEDEDVIAEPFDVPECNGEATRRAIVRAAASMAQEKTK